MSGAVGEQGGHSRASGGAGVGTRVTQRGALAMQGRQHWHACRPSSSMLQLRWSSSNMCAAARLLMTSSD